MEDGFVLFEVFFGIRAGAEFLASVAQGIQPRGVFRGILPLQFFSQTLGERRAFSVRGDGNLQISSLHDGAVVEMAVSDVVDGVAENASGSRGLKHSGVHGLNGSRGDD